MSIMLRAKVTIEGETMTSLPMNIDDITVGSNYQLDFKDGSYCMRDDLFGDDSVEWEIIENGS